MRSLLFLLAAVGVLVTPATVVRFTHQEPDLAEALAERGLATVVAVVLGVVALVELGLGLATLAGRNWARMWLMSSAVVTTVAAFGPRSEQSTRATLLGLPTTATAILLLLALSSHRARDFAARGRPRRPRTAGVLEGPPGPAAEVVPRTAAGPLRR